LKLCDSLDFETLSNDVKSFLINPEEINRVTMFREFIEGL
jgi:hypothetical protein